MKPHNENYDAIIIGSGAGGSAAAWRLSNYHKMRVLLLEAGPDYDPSNDYRLDKSSWERRNFPEKIQTRQRQTAASMQKLDPAWDHLHSWNHILGKFAPRGIRVFTRYDHVIGLGGSTLHYTGEAHRLHPAAMNMRSRFGVAADWPVSYDELESYYQLAEKLKGVAGPDKDKHRPRSAPPPLAPSTRP